MKKVLLYLPFKSHFYLGLYHQIKKGFEENGCLIRGGCEYLKPDQLIKEIEDFTPDIVFEMNRIKSDIINFPDNVIHICWLVDYWEKSHEEINKGSDFLYLFSKSWLMEHKGFEGNYIDVLYPGTDIDDYNIDPTISKKSDFIFLGHMPKPWNKDELSRIVYAPNKNIPFKNLINIVHDFTMNPKNYFDGTIATRKHLLNMLQLTDINTTNDRVLHYDIFMRLFREGRRLGILNNLIKTTQNITIYGNENWLLRKQFIPFYQKELIDTKAMNKAFNQHNFLVHDGNMPHFRVFDAMASGLLVFKPNVLEYGVVDEWEDLLFKDNQDIITYELNEKFIRPKVSDSQIKDLKFHIRNVIKSSHTWNHRIEKILKDIKHANR